MPLAPWTSTTIASSQIRNCGDSDLAERDEGHDRRGGVAHESRVALGVAAGIAHPDEQERRHAGDRRHGRGNRRDGSGQVLRARARRPAERHAERVVEREQHARAEALDLQRAPELAPDAPQRRPRARGSRTEGRPASDVTTLTASAAAPPRAPRRRQVRATSSGRSTAG